MGLGLERWSAHRHVVSSPRLLPIPHELHARCAVFENFQAAEEL